MLMVKVQADSASGEDGIFSLCPRLEEGAGGSLDLFHQDADPSCGLHLHGFVTREAPLLTPSHCV